MPSKWVVSTTILQIWRLISLPLLSSLLKQSSFLFVLLSALTSAVLLVSFRYRKDSDGRWVGAPVCCLEQKRRNWRTSSFLCPIQPRSGCGCKWVFIFANYIWEQMPAIIVAEDLKCGSLRSKEFTPTIWPTSSYLMFKGIRSRKKNGGVLSLTKASFLGLWSFHRIPISTTVQMLRKQNKISQFWAHFAI